MAGSVLYIVGTQNSGSTLLDAILGSSEHAFGLGEVGRVHDYRKHRRCNCGEPPFECAVCRPLLDDLRTTGALAEIDALFPKALGERRIVRFLAGRELAGRYARASDEIYRSVFARTGAEVLIDSSKNVSRAIALARHSEFDIYFLHMVRDGRGYVNSRNSKARLQRLGTKRRFFWNVQKWVVKNLLVSLFLRPLLSDNYRIVRYEDLINAPDRTIDGISHWCGVPFEDLRTLEKRLESVRRRQIYESPRAIGYRQVKIDPNRLRSQACSLAKNLRFFACGGFLSYLWGYGFTQDYLDETESVGPKTMAES